MNITEKKTKEIREKSRNCLVMKKLMETAKRGWPQPGWTRVSQDLHEHLSVRDALSEVDGVVIKGYLIVPLSSRPAMLPTLHSSHQGVEPNFFFLSELVRDTQKLLKNVGWFCHKYLIF